MMKRSLLVTLIALMLSSSLVLGADVPQSALTASGHDPIYTTYAAALERSEFVLDQGYHFCYDDTGRGADFCTDTAGDWCLAFTRGAQYVYRISEMAQAPVITASYPDLIKYYYKPFQDIRVEATFLVYSSRLALQDLAIQNLGTDSVKLKILPFLHNNHRTFDDIAFLPEANRIFFTHEELPDGWTLEHQMPYVDLVQDAWLFSFQPNRLTSFRSYRWGNVVVPQKFDLKKKPTLVVWGSINHADGEICRHNAPKPKLLAILNDHSDQILTETAPRWGSSEANINRYGFYALELGNFGFLKPGDSFTIQLWCEQSNQVGSVKGIVPADPVSALRLDLKLAGTTAPVPPAGVKRDVWGSGTEIRLYWDREANVSYDVYRRDYRTSAAYERIAHKLNCNFYTDKNLSGDPIYGYLVTAVDAQGRTSLPAPELTNITGSDFITDVKYPDQITTQVQDLARVIAVEKTLNLAPGQIESIRLIRAMARNADERLRLSGDAAQLMTVSLTPYLAANEKLFAAIPKPEFSDPDQSQLYRNAFSLMRQVMLPPEGKCSFNYYVFSREPTWGWGHGGQVFHESLTMLAYALMDPISAMNSQRVYRERQHNSGYINYRTGSYLDETIPYNDQLTTSAPWYAWQNWEIYQLSRDEDFLRDMYSSSVAFYNYYIANRDSDRDGLCEWGAHAILESVRDGQVAVWDQVDWPSNFEALDLNCMLVSEAKALAAMARKLGREPEARSWEADALARQEKINRWMWDYETGFYYHIDKNDHDFSFKSPNDLKRQEIIGFLPLWAGIAAPEQAARLVQVLTDSSKFWRPYGVPSLAADDRYYNAQGYWNGPVWVEWNYLIQRGLMQYGYHRQARQLVDRVAKNMIAMLKKNHTFWELYSPDDLWGGHHQTYIWAGLIARMLWDVNRKQ